MSSADAAGLLEAESLLAVHAHPDDETLATGSLLAELAARGARVAVVTATRGELGEVVDPALADLAGSERLGPFRAAELRQALGALGVQEHYWLGEPPARATGPARSYRDSGMTWLREGVAGPDPRAAADPRSFVSAPEAEVVDDLAALVARLRPAVLVSYDEEGGYGHPDHVRCHRATLTVGRRAGVPVWAAGAELGRDHRAAGELLELPHRARQVAAALSAYRTQLRFGGGIDDEIEHPDGFRHAVPTSLRLRRLA